MNGRAELAFVGELTGTDRLRTVGSSETAMADNVEYSLGGTPFTPDQIEAKVRELLDR